MIAHIIIYQVHANRKNCRTERDKIKALSLRANRNARDRIHRQIGMRKFCTAQQANTTKKKYSRKRIRKTHRQIHTKKQRKQKHVDKHSKENNAAKRQTRNTRIHAITKHEHHPSKELNSIQNKIPKIINKNKPNSLHPALIPFVLCHSVPHYSFHRAECWPPHLGLHSSRPKARQSSGSRWAVRVG